MNTYIYNMRKELHNYAIKVQNEYYANKNVSKYRIKYLIVANIYEIILSLNSEDLIKDYLNVILDNSNKCKKLYDDLYSKFSTEKDTSKKAQLLKELNEYGARLNAYNESYNIISKVFSRKDNKTPVVSQTKVETKIEPTTNQSKEEKELTHKQSLENDDTKLSDRIISLLEKYNELDKNTTEAKRILEEVYNLRLDREKRFKTLYGANYRVYITSLESIENMASMTQSEGFKTVYLDENSYISELRTAINAINEYYFINELQIKKYYKKNNGLSDGINDNKFLKKYNNYLRKYHVLISSLFKDRCIDFMVDEDTINSDDLLSYLSTCNLDGDFSVYKSKFLGSKIGTIDADKKKYNETLLFLNRCINSLCEKVKDKSKGKKIAIVDKEPVKADIIKQRNDKLKEIYFLSMMGNKENRGIANERK